MWFMLLALVIGWDDSARGLPDELSVMNRRELLRYGENVAVLTGLDWTWPAGLDQAMQGAHDVVAAYWSMHNWIGSALDRQAAWGPRARRPEPDTPEHGLSSPFLREREWNRLDSNFEAMRDSFDESIFESLTPSLDESLVDLLRLCRRRALLMRENRTFPGAAVDVFALVGETVADAEFTPRWSLETIHQRARSLGRVLGECADVRQKHQSNLDRVQAAMDRGEATRDDLLLVYRRPYIAEARVLKESRRLVELFARELAPAYSDSLSTVWFRAISPGFWNTHNVDRSVPSVLARDDLTEGQRAELTRIAQMIEDKRLQAAREMDRRYNPPASEKEFLEQVEKAGGYEQWQRQQRKEKEWRIQFVREFPKRLERYERMVEAVLADDGDDGAEG